MAMVGSFEAWRTAIDVFSKYNEGQIDSVLHHAEHDQIWGGPDPAEVTEADLQILSDNGWHADYEQGCFYQFV